MHCLWRISIRHMYMTVKSTVINEHHIKFTFTTSDWFQKLSSLISPSLESGPSNFILYLIPLCYSSTKLMFCLSNPACFSLTQQYNRPSSASTLIWNLSHLSISPTVTTDRVMFSLQEGPIFYFSPTPFYLFEPGNHNGSSTTFGETKPSQAFAGVSN